MKALRTITNHYLDVQVFDVDPSAARGPFVVIQEGCAPGDDTGRAKIFALQQDGAWADIAYYLAGSGQKRIGKIVFPSMGAVMELLCRLEACVNVEPCSATVEEMASWHAAHPEVLSGLENLKRWASDFRRNLQAS